MGTEPLAAACELTGCRYAMPMENMQKRTKEPGAASDTTRQDTTRDSHQRNMTDNRCLI